MSAQVVTDNEAVLFDGVAEWREWLAANGRAERSLWVVVRRHRNDGPGLDYVASVEHALCFGWVDGKTMRRDAESTYQSFTPRNPRSTWSQSNRDRVERLIAEGLMTEAGQEVVDHARRTGTWDCLAEAQNGIIPADLQLELDRNPTAARHFQSFPPSSKRLILEWIALAKRPDTRARRIHQTITLATENRRANHPK